MASNNSSRWDKSSAVSEFHRSSPSGPEWNGVIPPFWRKPRWEWVGGGFFFLVVLFTSCFTVQPEQRAVVKRLGRVNEIANPGFHFKLPLGIDRVQRVPTERILKQEFGFRTEDASGDRTKYSEGDFTPESLMLTGDLNMIDVEWVVQYRIDDPVAYLYSMRDPERTLRDISESIMRRIVGNHLGSEVLTTARGTVATLARDELHAAMRQYKNGIRVLTVQLQDVVPPEKVRPAFNDVNMARQERERMINEARREANQAIPQAEGEALRTIAKAQGYAAERVNRAKGESARFTAVLAEYRQAPEVTRSRMYLEALSQALPKVGSVVVVENSRQAPIPIMPLRNAALAPSEAADAKLAAAATLSPQR